MPENIALTMTNKRRAPANTLNVNFRSSDTFKNEGKGRKPLPEPTSVKQVFVMMIVHICRKILFVDTKRKIIFYLGSLFLVSLITDIIPIPKTYFSRTSNVLNQYFVKLGWAWTLAVTLPFVFITSITYCCGNRQKVCTHLLRLLIGTLMWFFWTKLFVYVESSYGKCIGIGVVPTKSICLERGFLWNGFDISGHAFILIHSSLTIVEEARAICGWESIKDFIRKEEHNRASKKEEFDKGPLAGLSSSEFSYLKLYYQKFTPYVRALFIVMACFMVIWDVMLFSTIIYFHIMVEKFISGAIAILVWFFTYNWWYSSPRYPPPLPGDGGCFRYKEFARSRESVSGVTATTSIGARKRSLGTAANERGQVPKFMGMPLYGLQKKVPESKDKVIDLATSETDTTIQ